MIQLKEIKPKEYMKGTKAFRYQVYIYLGMIGFATICSIPAFLMSTMPDRNSGLTIPLSGVLFFGSITPIAFILKLLQSRRM